MRLSRPVFLCLIFVLAHLAGCGGEDPVDLVVDPGGAATLVQQANQELENTLFEDINSNPDHPTDLDFSKAHGLYSNALALDPENLDARFGLSITGLLILTSDSEVIAAFDEWEAYLTDNTPFEVPGTSVKPLGISIGFAMGKDAMRLPYQIIQQVALVQPLLAMNMADPQLGRAQAILRDRVLPKLTDAITHLGAVADDPGYNYIVTPRMQGDLLADQAEIDRTDILAFRAGASLLSAACRVLVAYEYGIATYDSTGMANAMMPGSSWMTLTEGGEAHMVAVPTDLLRATDDIDAALEELLLETDSQHDDVIKIDPQGLSQVDVQDIRDELPRIRATLNNGATFLEDWDNQYLTPPVPLKVHVGDSFRTPVQDWKTLLPEYTATVAIASQGSSYPFTELNGVAQVSVEVPQAGTYFANFFYNSRLGEEVRIDHFGEQSFRQPFLELMETQLQGLDLSDCYDFITGSIFFDAGLLNQGTNIVSVSWLLTVGESSGCYYAPHVTWAANSFNEWTFPDPTFNGLLPEMTNISDIYSVFGFDPQDWTKEFTLRW